MLKKPQPNDRPAPPPGKDAAAVATTAPYEKVEPIPVPEVIEGDAESTWGLWEQAIAAQEKQMDGFDNTLPLPIRQPDKEG
jgi:hypothetical protein